MIYATLFISALIIPTALVAVYVVVFLALPAIRGAVYIPSKWERVRIMVDMLDIKEGDKAIDVGSGDGRLIIEMAKKGADAYGVEINPFLVLWSKYHIKKQGLKGKAHVSWKNQWNQDFGEFNKVAIYGIPYIMASMEKKFQKELGPGSLVVSNAFPFPNWKPEKEEGEVNGVIRLYKK